MKRKKILSLSVSTELIKDIDNLSEINCLSRSETVERLLRMSIKLLEVSDGYKAEVEPVRLSDHKRRIPDEGRNGV